MCVAEQGGSRLHKGCWACSAIPSPPYPLRPLPLSWLKYQGVCWLAAASLVGCDATLVSTTLGRHSLPNLSILKAYGMRCCVRLWQCR